MLPLYVDKETLWEGVRNKVKLFGTKPEHHVDEILISIFDTSIL